MKHIHIITRAQAKSRGLVRYFTAKPCKYGHLAERRTSVGHCVECLRILQNTPKWVERRRAAYLADRDRVLEICKNWRRNNKEAKSRAAAKLYRATSDQVKAKVRQWKKDNPERAMENDRRRYLENRVAILESNRKWRRENPGAVRAHCSAKRARQSQALLLTHSDFTNYVMAEASALAKVREQRFGFAWQVDHMVPLKGLNVCGLHIWYNFEVIPAVANYRKGVRHIHTRPLMWLRLID